VVQLSKCNNYFFLLESGQLAFGVNICTGGTIKKVALQTQSVYSELAYQKKSKFFSGGSEGKAPRSKGVWGKPSTLSIFQFFKTTYVF